jgi:hypothetical protein
VLGHPHPLDARRARREIGEHRLAVDTVERAVGCLRVVEPEFEQRIEIAVEPFRFQRQRVAPHAGERFHRPRVVVEQPAVQVGGLDCRSPLDEDESLGHGLALFGF